MGRSNLVLVLRFCFFNFQLLLRTWRYKIARFELEFFQAHLRMFWLVMIAVISRSLCPNCIRMIQVAGSELKIYQTIGTKLYYWLLCILVVILVGYVFLGVLITTPWRCRKSCLLNRQPGNIVHLDISLSMLSANVCLLSLL